jgi:hypothetical protein
MMCGQLALMIQEQLISAGMINADYVCVQCTYFEKSVKHNCLVAPHQDLSIPVRSRREHRELGGWSMKDGELFVQPPVKVIEELLCASPDSDPSARQLSLLFALCARPL